ncbi:HdeD family acid-resistance protein [Dietzia sp. ANT_WB102]|uniref:HdeD family acid-resistance protein n=1 Tax=Dietzia sp. ANT_WB102 TaxID=2597345 RepID=UPI0011EDE3C2|nr:DUF308 domain-containing protein [Dietzia sp. ANT_WB102]KAA0919231.1 hypothetical protein FQ137_08185 [Dietzia sp. ANT_WB102]
MIETLVRNWWVQLIRGALAIALGATALVSPGTSMTLAIFLVAAFAIGDGAMAVTTGLAMPNGANGRNGMIFAGVGFIILGLVVLFWPGLTTTALTLLFAAWLVASGVLVIVGARTLSAEISNSWMMAVLGAVLVVLGIGLALVGPDAITTFVNFAGWFGLAVGAIMVAVAFRLRADTGQLGARRTDAA